jgi:hypothetical protein
MYIEPKATQWISKVYVLDDLLINHLQLKDRCTKIELFTLDSQSPTKFERCGRFLTRRSLKIRSNPSARPTIDLNLLASQLDKAHKIGLVHGDIHPKNIVPAVGCIDWEPSLYQEIRGRAALMCTHPWIDRDDAAEKRVTLRTDILCFTRLALGGTSHFLKTSNWHFFKKSATEHKLPFTYCLNNLTKFL